MRRDSQVKQSQHKPSETALWYLGLRINNLRVAKGYSLQELADRIGMSRSGMSRFESGLREPSLEVLRMLSVEFPEIIGMVTCYLKNGYFSKNQDRTTGQEKFEKKPKAS
jgi:transcriptional regulator with XRE-family HTH domain